MNFEEFYEQKRQIIDNEIKKLILGYNSREKMEYILEKGKRLRPVLALLVFESLNGKNYKKAIEAITALELMHTASLVHDDILDEDTTRRGKETAHLKFGVGEAILLGHKLISGGLAMLIGHGMQIMKTLINVWDSVLQGEISDISVLRTKLANMKTPGENFYYDIIKKKTASLFAGSCKCAVIEAKKDEKIQEKFWNYGEQVGIAYQMADDYVDLKGGKVETLPIIFIAQFEENVKNQIFNLISEGKASPIEILESFGLNAKSFFLNGAKNAIKNATDIIGDWIPNKELIPVLKEAPKYIVNKMLDEVGERIK